MLDMSKLNDVEKASSEMHRIAMAFHMALATRNLVELRVEDLPSMKMDSILKTSLKDVSIDESDNLLRIEADNLQFMFKYESFSMGSSSASHDKFYFKSENVCLTVVVSL